MPLGLQEYGLSAWNSPFFPNGHTEPEQAEYYADILAALRATDSPGALAWTLYAFGGVPAGVASRAPWRTGPQKNLGVLHADGRPKQAAGLLAPDVPLAVTRVRGWAHFLKPFWLLPFGGLVGAVALLIVGRHRLLALRRVLRGAMGRVVAWRWPRRPGRKPPTE